MARTIGKLSDVRIKHAKNRGYIADGGGLYLQVSAHGSKSWVFRFRDSGKLREMGLGPLHTISLKEAREAALLCRKQRLAGIDPIAARRSDQAAARLELAKAMSFQQCAQAYVDSHQSAWRNAKHASQWAATLSTYAYPILGSLPVQAIDVALVLKVIEPLWAVKTETASRLRGRIESVLDWATARGLRTGENPARWRGHLDHLLPPRSKIRKVEHHAALPYSESHSFVEVLRKQEGMSARALEFAILTAARTTEVLGATWAEIDLSGAVWIIPEARMKAGKEHRIPLSQPALAILSKLSPARVPTSPVFPGARSGKGLSNMAFLTLLRRMNRSDITAHGFRSTFRDWAAERTNFPREVAEQALAHSLPDKVEAAYRRSDLFEKRRRLMNEWAAFIQSPMITGHVVSIHTAK
jgi:integrase